MNMISPDVSTLFAAEQRPRYDFSQAPRLIRYQTTTPAATVFQGEELARWQAAQQLLLRWTRDRQIFTAAYVQQGKAIYERFFQQHGPLRGNVLDIGGGWGLYREWWEPTENAVFIVHDPGIERFLRGAHELHHQFYERAFRLPMTFVEGFGEELPYEANTFDSCLIASVLDHCVDPARVLAAVQRCLKPGGVLLILQQGEGQSATQPTRRRSLAARLAGLLSNPQRLFTVLRTRLFYKEPHLHHFTVAGLQTLLAQAGYTGIEVTFVPDSGRIYAFTARKAQG